VARTLGLVGLVPVGLVALLGLHGDPPYPLELALPFRAQALFGGLVLAGVLALLRSRWAALALALGLMNLGAVLSLWSGSAEPPSAGPALRLLLANVFTHNGEHDRLIELVRAERPDVLVLEETDERWLAALSVLHDDYPHRVARPRSDNFGIALFSKLPLHRTEVLQLAAGETPTLVTELEHGGVRHTLIAVHPWPPSSSGGARHRRRTLAEVERLVAGAGRRVLVVGDLNCTPWCRPLVELLAHTGLRSAGAGRGWRATWPAGLPAPLRIPLDHVLVGPAYGVLEQRLGPDVGSDHLPLLVDLH